MYCRFSAIKNYFTAAADIATYKTDSIAHIYHKQC